MRTLVICALLGLQRPIFSQFVFAVDPPKVLVVPTRATILIGETQTFRAVGQDGRPLHGVRWRVSPEYSTKLTVDGDEATMLATQTSGSVIITASAGNGSAEGELEIKAGTSMPIGSTKWSVEELPGCKTIEIMPAVPSAGGPDIYARETCSDGDYVRAITEDGRELWRHKFDNGSPVPHAVNQSQSTQHINPGARSVCDEISTGNTMAAVSEIARARLIVLQPKEKESTTWLLEEPDFRCQVFFNAGGAVIKKKKILVAD